MSAEKCVLSRMRELRVEIVFQRENIQEILFQSLQNCTTITWVMSTYIPLTQIPDFSDSSAISMHET